MRTVFLHPKYLDELLFILLSSLRRRVLRDWKGVQSGQEQPLQRSMAQTMEEIEQEVAQRLEAGKLRIPDDL